MTIKIEAVTEKGTKAIRQHLDGLHKLKRTERTMQKMLGIVHQVTNQDPLTITIEIRKKRLAHVVKTKHLTQQIEETLDDNGASTGDYKIEVI